MEAELLRGRSASVAGIAYPGPIDADGNVHSTPTVLGSRGRKTAILAKLQRLWPSMRIVLMNDVTAAGFYHRRHPRDTFCIVTVSSGVGNKIFVNGQPIVGNSGFGGEIGHVRVDSADDAAVCDCGGTGHLGAIASGRGALLAARKKAYGDPAAFRRSSLGEHVHGDPERIDNELIVAAFHATDAWTVGVITECLTPLAQVLATLHTALGIERFVLIGGFALALGESYRVRLAEVARQSCWDLGQDWNQMIVLAHSDDRAGLVGAGRSAFGECQRSM